MTYKLNNSEARIISQIFQANGFREVGPSNQDFNIMWTSCNPNPNIFKSLLPHQRVNHFPRSYELTRKVGVIMNPMSEGGESWIQKQDMFSHNLMVNYIGLATLFQIDGTTFMCRQRTNILTGKRII